MMEPTQPNFEVNWTEPPKQQNTPGALAAMILGIVSLSCFVLLNFCYCMGSLPALITGIIGWVLGKKAIKLYESNPELYKENSLKMAKAGKLMSLIGTILSALSFLVLIVLLIIFGVASLSEFDTYNKFN